jgi:hypothetical protein
MAPTVVPAKAAKAAIAAIIRCNIRKSSQISPICALHARGKY